MRYTQAYDGEWNTPTKRTFYVRCCACGLAHRIHYRIRDGKVQYRAWRVRRRKSKPVVLSRQFTADFKSFLAKVKAAEAKLKASTP